VDHKLRRLKELIELKEQTDAELEALLGGAPLETAKQRKPKTCSVCDEEGHTARTCKKKGNADVHSHQDDTRPTLSLLAKVLEGGQTGSNAE
jgi:hypothetical protein